MKPQANRVRLTAGRVDAFICPADKSQAFLWDTEAPALALRVTPTGRKTYVFEARLNGATLRIGIGTSADWPLDKARNEAQRLKMLVDSGQDPREIDRQQQAIRAAEQVTFDSLNVAVSAAWSAYLEARRPYWGERHFDDHVKLARAGGKVSNRGTRGRGVTVAAPLHQLMDLKLSELTTEKIESWASREAKTRPTPARLAWRLLKAFLTWCSEQPQFAAALPNGNPAKTKRARESLGKPRAKQDALMGEQLPAWFSAVSRISSPTISVYLQVLLLTGARPGEVRAMRWDDLNTQWRGLTIRDKVEGERVIPLTRFVHHLLTTLPRRNEFVFASNPRGGAKTAATMATPNTALTRACEVAGIDGLTLHGLRRSFGSLSEWLDVPAGVVAQIQGHKPSATAEKHYRVRPLDLLRLHHQKIEDWILQQAGVQFDAAAEPGALRVVRAA